MKLLNSTKGGIIYVILLFFVLNTCRAASVSTKDVIHYSLKGQSEVSTINSLANGLMNEGEYFPAEFCLMKIMNKYPHNYQAVLNLDNFYLKYYKYKEITTTEKYESDLKFYRVRLWLSYLVRSKYARENPNALSTAAVLTEDETPIESLKLINHAVAIAPKFKKQISNQVRERMKADRDRIEQKAKNYNEEEYFDQ